MSKIFQIRRRRRSGLLFQSSAAVVPLALMLAAPALAQTIPPDSPNARASDGAPGRGDTVMGRERPDTDPRGVPVSEDWRLYPSVDAAERYDDNIRAQPGGGVSDYVTLIDPQLKLVGRPGEGRYEINLFGHLQEYAEETQESAEDFGADFGYASPARQRLMYNAQAGFERQTQDRGDAEEDPNLPRSQSDRFFAKAGIGYDTGQTRFTLDAAARRINFRQDLNADRDRYELIVAPKVTFTRTETTGFHLFGRYRRVGYDNDLDRNGFHRDRQEGTAGAGLDLDFGGLIFGQIEAGATKLWFDDPQFEDGAILTGAARLIWNPTRLTTVTLDGEREAYATIQPTAPVRIDSRVGLGVDHELRRNVILSAAAAYIHQDFRGIARNDDVLELSADIGYRPGRNWELYAGYMFRDRRSSLDQVEFDRNRVMIGLKLQL